MRASTRHRLLTGACLGVDGFDKAGLTDSDMNKPGRRIEERHVRRARDWPDIPNLAGARVDLLARAK